MAYLCNISGHWLDEAVIEVLYDSQYAASMSQALWRPSTNNTLIAIASGLQTMHRQIRTITFTHVKAHDGNPWNEAADRMCVRGGTGQCNTFGSVSILRPRVERPLFAEWAFLFWAQPATRAAYPPLCLETGWSREAKVTATYELYPPRPCASRRADALTE